MQTENNKGKKLDCLEQWKKERRKATNALKIIKCEYDKACQEYDNASILEGELKKYRDNVVDTNEITKDVVSKLKLFLSKLDIICSNTKCTEGSVKILFCLLIEYFECADRLKEKISHLNKEIECMNNPDLNPKSSIILGCLAALSTKLNEVIATQKDIISKIVGIIQQALTLNDAVALSCPNTEEGEHDCDENDPKLDKISHFGLKEMVNLLIAIMEGLDTGEADSDEDEKCGGNLCEGNLLPIDCKDYYKDIETQYDDAVGKKEEKKKKKDKKEKKYSKTKSCKKGLDDAIKAADSAKNCK